MNAVHFTIMPPEHRLPPSPGMPQPALQRPAGRRGLLTPASEPFGALVELQLATCRRHGVGTGVVWIRLVGVEALAEDLGPGGQRQLLESVQQRLQGRLRHVDKVCAVAQDTFGVALFDARPGVMQGIEQRLHRELSAAYRVGGEIVSLQVMVGSSLSPHANLTSMELMRRAADSCGMARA
jgi:predicted signal transduction protein with EAL and GGDEF domain